MGIAIQQELKNKGEVADRKWSVRKLFPSAAVVSVMSKTFVNVFDILLGLSVITICISELIGGDISILMATVTSILCITSYRIKEAEIKTKAETKPKEKS